MDPDKERMSLAYVEAKAGSREGVAKVRQELADFEKKVRIASIRQQRTLHPDKVAQAQGGLRGSGAGEISFDTRRRLDTSDAQEKFTEANVRIRDMISGLSTRLDHLEKAHGG